MSTGKEFLHRVSEALNTFEEAVAARERRKLGTKVPLQQDVDRAREGVIKTIVDIVTQARMEGSKGQ